MDTFYRLILALIILTGAAVGCYTAGAPTPTPTAAGATVPLIHTPTSPTDTPFPATATPIPSTATSIPPTVTPLPASAAVAPGVNAIAFLSYNSNYTGSEIRSVQLDGRNLQSVPNSSDAATLDWSPDGKRFAFVEHHGDAEWALYAIDANGQNRQRLSQGEIDFIPRWSPDGTQIAFVRECNLWVARISDETPPKLNDLRQLTAEPQKCVWALSWSPDGEQIAFDAQLGNPQGTASYGDPFSAEIYVVNADGSNLRQLTDNRAVESAPSWSPDGKRIVFASNQDRDTNYTLKDAFAHKGSGAFQLYIMDANGENVRRLTNTTANDMFPAWSPDGLQIAFSSDRDGNLEIYVINADGSQPTRLTDSPRADSYPVWKPIGAVQPAANSTPTTPLILGERISQKEENRNGTTNIVK